jgi:hypothetical protein
MVAISDIHDVVLLFDVLNGFEGLLEPLFEPDAHLVMAQFVENSNETFQSGVTSLVKSAVIKEFIHGILLALDNDCFDQLESCL